MFLGGVSLVHIGAQVISSLFLLAQNDHREGPQVVDAPIKSVHVPSGLDSNDVAQFIIEGEFPNTCYSVGRAIVRARQEELEQGMIVFHLEAIKTKRDKCLDVKTPYLKVIDLGILPAGRYSLVQLKNMKTRAILNIKEVKQNSPMDNYNYAPVDAVYVREDALGFRRLAVLIGTFTNSCMKFRPDTPVYRAHEKSRVVEILPIVQMEGDACVEVMKPFFYTVEIPDAIPSGRYLFHVRTMNGNSLNKLDTIKME